MTLNLPPGWQATNSSVSHCYKRGDYRCYIFSSFMGEHETQMIRGYGVRKVGDWIIPRTFPPPKPLTSKNIQTILAQLIDEIFIYEL